MFMMQMINIYLCDSINLEKPSEVYADVYFLTGVGL
jgi:hypothetical protein